METLSPEVEAGQAYFTPGNLRVYDAVVLGFNCRFVWKCPTPRILRMYDEHVSANHLDVGVGTGWFLDHCRFPASEPRLGLMDLNPNSLATTAARVARYHPKTYRRNVLEPIAFDDEPFDSIGMNYLLHCVPGAMRNKAVVFDHLGALLRPGGVLFGATLVTEGAPRSAASKALMRYYNWKRVFSNTEDSVHDLEAALRSRFPQTHVEVVGSAVLFSARK